MTAIPSAKTFPLSSAINQLGHLTLGGCDVVDLVTEFGSPLYVYDEQSLRTIASSFISAFSSRHQKTDVAYASKAFINVSLARLLAGCGMGFDVVSGGEVAVLKAADVDPSRIYFHGNNKTVRELTEALDWGVGRIVLDSFHELSILEEIASGMGKIQPVMIRVSPGVDPHTHHHTTTGVLDSKFGFPIETGDAEHAVYEAMSAQHLDLQGLHFHLGSPIFELQPYAEAIRVVLKFAARMEDSGFVLRSFSPGGGFAIAYTEQDSPPTIEEYAQVIVQALKSGCAEFGLAEPELIVEPGRAITGPAGVALYTVGAIKVVPGVRTYVSVDGGMGDNIRPALYDSQYVAIAASRVASSPVGAVTIAGKYCESGDVLVRDALLPTLESGDIIAIPASGAYAPSMASTYNLNGRPAIVLASDGKATLIRRRESYADLMSTDIV